MISTLEKTPCRSDLVHAGRELIGIEISGGTAVDPACHRRVQPSGPSVFTDQWGKSHPGGDRKDGDEGEKVLCYAAEICRDCGFDLVMIYVGCEARLQLAMDGRDVSILEMREDVFLEATADYRRFFLPYPEEKVKLFCSMAVKEITEDDVSARNRRGEEQFFPADSVLLATGLKSRNPEPLCSDEDQLIVIGDAKKLRKVYHAVREGFDAAVYLH